MASLAVKGTISIEIDSKELEASLVFDPSPEGQEWTADAVMRLAVEKRLSPPPPPRFLDETLQKWAKVKEKVSVQLSRGTAPIAPEPESVTWADLPIDGELAPLVEDTLKKAPPPDIWRIKTEKVKRETIVKKPAALPFLPPKEELVVTWDKKETREQVFVDATVKETLYAPKGVKIGTVFPPKQGKPGKSVYAKPIPPPLLGDPYFLTGNGILRDKNDLKAEISGVVRIGDGWADILPLARCSYQVQSSSDGTTMFLWYEPGDRRLKRATAAEILAEAIAKGGTDLLPEEELVQVLDKALKNQEPLEAFPLSRRHEAVAEVLISADKLKATLHLRKAVAGAPTLQPKAASEAIRTSGVRGFKTEEVRNTILSYFKGTDLELSLVLVEGKAPTRGKDREIKPAVPFIAEELSKTIIARLCALEGAHGAPLPAGDATAAFVSEGCKVASLTKDSAGTPGVDIFGTPIPAIPGNDPDIALEGGLHLSKDEITAEISGVLVVRHEGSVYHARVLPYRDAEATVRIAEDSMTAAIDIRKEEGAGLPASPELITAALTGAGVVKGLSPDTIATAAKSARVEGGVKGVIVARGEPPVPGGSASITWLVERASGRAVTLAADGRANFKTQDRFKTVAEGTPIAEVLRQGEAGRDGWNVRGEVIEAAKGESVQIEHDATVREEQIEGGFRLIACRTGELQFDGKKLFISSFHGIKGDVGMGTGNIKFPGEIRVTGNVSAGFAVMGEADVSIAGSAEAALISAGGKAVVGQGVIGAGKGVVRARKGIDAGFVEHATLLAVEDIRIKSGCLQSHVKTNGKLRLISEKGNLIGGFCRARLGVECANLGNERGARTEISFGQDYLVMDQIELSERESEKIKGLLSELDRRLKELADTGANLDKARAEKVRLMKLLEQHTMRLFTLREKYEEHHQSEIRVRGAVFPGVVLESHGRYHEVKQKKNQIVFVFDRELGRITEKPLK